MIAPKTEHVNIYFRMRIMGIGERVKQVRESAGLNQRDFAARLATSAGRISEIEQDKSVPGGDFLARLHSEFGADLNWVLTGTTAAGTVPSTPTLAPDEAALLDNYRNTPPEKRGAIREVGAALAKRRQGKCSA